MADVAGRYAEAGQRDRAAQVLSEAIQAAESMENKAGVLALVATAGKYAEAGQKEWAAEVLSEATRMTKKIWEAYSKAKALADIAGEYAKAGQEERAAQVLSEAIQTVNSIEQPLYKTWALAEIADKYVEMGQKERATMFLSESLQVINRIRPEDSEYGYKQKALVDIAIGLANVGQLNRALKIVDALEFLSDKVEAIVGIANKSGEAGQADQAVEILTEGLQVVKTRRGKVVRFDDDDFALSEIATKFAELGRFDKAKETVRAIGFIDAKERALAGIAYSYAKIGQLDQALQLVEKIKYVPKEKARILCEIAIGYARAGKLNQALQAARRIEPGRYRLDFNYRDIVAYETMALADIAKKCSEIGQLDKALEVASQTQGEMLFRDRLLSGISEKYAEAGQLDRAVKVAFQISRAEFHIRAFATIFGKYAELEGKRSEKNRSILRDIVYAIRPVSLFWKNNP